MRGGTSRGPVLRAEDAPEAGAERDSFALSLVGRSMVDGLGGGTPTTSKVVLVQPGRTPGVDFEYIVGNLAPEAGTVDWSGTCGNMTAAVVPYAAGSGLLPDDHIGGNRFRLRNLATDGLVDVTVADPASLLAGEEVRLTTSYLSPGGAVLRTTLPSGRAQDVIGVEGKQIAFTLIDVTHPYLFIRYEQVVGRSERVSDRATLDRVERIRAAVCVELGLVRDAASAAQLSASVPRVVLIHQALPAGADLYVTAVSMGHAIASVPVTAAMSLAAAARIPGTLVAEMAGAGSAAGLCIAGPKGTIRAQAVVDGSGVVTSASADRTARRLLEGTAWV